MKLSANDCEFVVKPRVDGQLQVWVSSDLGVVLSTTVSSSLRAAGKDPQLVAELFSDRPVYFAGDSWQSLERIRGNASFAMGSHLPSLTRVDGTVEVDAGASAPLLFHVTQSVALKRAARLEKLLLVDRDVSLYVYATVPSMVGVGGDLILVNHGTPSADSLRFIGGAVMVEQGASLRWRVESHLEGPQQRMGKTAALRSTRHWVAIQRGLSEAISEPSLAGDLAHGSSSLNL